MPGGVRGRDQRGQHLRRADVAGGAVPPDVLLAGLEGEAEADPPGGVPGDAHHPSGGPAGMRGRGGEEGGVGSAAAHGHSEALGRADRDVGAERARRIEQGQRQQVGGDHRSGPGLLGLLDEGPPFADPAPSVGVLDDDSRDVLRYLLAGIAQVTDLETDARRPGAGFHDREGLRMEGAVGEEDRTPLRRPVAHGHRLGRRRPFIEERSARHREPGDVRDHGLEVEQDLQPPLGNLGLVGGVLGVPARVLEDVPEDDGRGDRAVVAAADEVPERPVLPGDRPQFLEQLSLRERGGQVEGVADANVARNRLRDQLVPRGQAELMEHSRLLGQAGADVPPDERRGAAGEVAGGWRTDGWRTDGWGTDGWGTDGWGTDGWGSRVRFEGSGRGSQGT